MLVTRGIVGAGLVVAAVVGVDGAAGKATGYFRLDKVRSTFSSACAFKQPDPSGTGATTYVVLSDKILDCEAADQSFDPIDAIKQQVEAQKPAFVTFTVPAGAAKVERIDGGWTSSDPEDGFSFGGQGTIAIKTNTDALVQGRYFLEKPSDFFDKTFQFDFTWDTVVLSGSMAGTPVAAGGGEIGAAYKKYLAAIAKGDLTAVRASVTAARAAEVPAVKGPDVKKLVGLMQMFELKTATITGGVQRGDDALLLVKGDGFDKLPSEGRVVMRRESGAWKVAKVKMKSPF